jgi:flavin reductase (DIM6/NTAB) family NADH-FMN oxidoreductase RutF
MVTTVGKRRPNIMTMSWHTILEFEPPLVDCVISNRNYSFDMLMTGKECVINIPTVALAGKVVGVGNCSGSKVDNSRNSVSRPLPSPAYSRR